MGKGKLKISEYAFKQYLQEHYVSEDGSKVSDRVLWGTKDFFEDTGMFKTNEYTGIREIVSTGTISYHKKKLNLKEEDIFKYHQMVSCRIGEDIEYEEWSKLNNRGHKKVKVLTESTIKKRLIKYMGLNNSVFNKYTYEEIKKICLEAWKESGLNCNLKMKEFYESLKVVM